MFLYFTIILLFLENIKLESINNVELIKGKNNEEPSNICTGRGLLNLNATTEILPFLRSLLLKNNIPHALVSGWHEDDLDHVVHVNGAVSPFENATNNTGHAFCVRGGKLIEGFGNVEESLEATIERGFGRKAIQDARSYNRKIARLRYDDVLAFVARDFRRKAVLRTPQLTSSFSFITASTPLPTEMLSTLATSFIDPFFQDPKYRGNISTIVKRFNPMNKLLSNDIGYEDASYNTILYNNQPKDFIDDDNALLIQSGTNRKNYIPSSVAYYTII
jgi:hypothetical protein